MAALGIILTTILGYTIVQYLLKGSSFITALGLSGLVGLGIQTFMMFLLSVSGIRFTAPVILIITVVLILVFVFFNYRSNQIIFFKKRYFATFSFTQEIGYINIVWILCMALVCYILIVISLKSLYWPTYNGDAITSFDLYAKALASEGKLINSLILENRVGFGVAYPPLYSMGVAYYYQIGFTNPNIISVVFLVSFALSFYGLSKTALNNSTAAAFFTLAVISIPEFLGQAAVNISSCPQAILAAISVIAFTIWFRDPAKAVYLNLSALLLGLAGFTRSESIVYMLPVFVIIGWLFIKRKGINLKQVIMFAALATFPFLAWQIYLKAHHVFMDKFAQVELMSTFNSLQLTRIVDLAFRVVTSSQYYGVSQYMVIVTFILTLISLRKNRKDLVLFLIILSSFLCYLLLLNQMKLRADSFDNILNYSGKRFFFGMFILMWFCLASNHYISFFFDKVHRLISKTDK